MDSQWSSYKQQPPTNSNGTTTTIDAPRTSSTRNYRTIYDPELDRGRTKQGSQLKYQYEGDTNDTTPPEDPRLNFSNRGKDLSKGRKTYRTELDRAHFEFDQYSIGPKPLATVLVTNLSSLTTETQIATYMSVYGQVERVDIERNPATGGSLGIALVGFGGNGHAAAKLAVEKGNRRKMGPASAVKIEYDPTGEKLKAAILEASSESDPSTKIDSALDKSSSLYDKSRNVSAQTSLPNDLKRRQHYHEENELVDKDISKWSRYDSSYRYQRSREYVDNRYYNDSRYRGYSNGTSSYSPATTASISDLPPSSSALPPPTSMPPQAPMYSSSSRYPMPHSSYSRNYDLDRYESTSRSSSYGSLPPPTSSLKWDPSSKHHTGITNHSRYKSRSRSRSRSIGRESSYYENDYHSGSRSRWDYDSGRGDPWECDWDRRRKRSDYRSTRDDRRLREDRTSTSEKQPSLVISRKHLPFVRGILEELRKVFYHYNFLEIYHDDDNWQVVFDSISTANRALAAIDGQSILGYVLQMTLQDPAASSESITDVNDQQEKLRQQSLENTNIHLPSTSTTSLITNSNLEVSSSESTTKDSSLVKSESSSFNNIQSLEPDHQLDDQSTKSTDQVALHSSNQDQVERNSKQTQKYGNVMDHAKQILFDQLADVFLKDLKNRVVGPCIYDFLNPVLYKRATTATQTVKRGDFGVLSATTINVGDTSDTSSDNKLVDNALASSAPSVTGNNGSTLPDIKSATSIDTSTPISSSNSTIDQQDDIKKDDGAFSLPKPEEKINEGPLPSLNKLPRFKKRSTSTAYKSSTTSEHTRNGLYHQHSRSSSQKYNNYSGSSDSDNDDIGQGNGYSYDDSDNQQAYGYKPMKHKRKLFRSTFTSERRDSNDTASSLTSAMASNIEKSGTFFSSSEEGEYQSGASLPSSDHETGKASSSTTIVPTVTTPRKGSKMMDRKKPRRLRDYLSDDEENELDQEVHDSFLRRLHREDDDILDDSVIKKEEHVDATNGMEWNHVDGQTKSDSTGEHSLEDMDEDDEIGVKLEWQYKKQRKRSKQRRDTSADDTSDVGNQRTPLSGHKKRKKTMASTNNAKIKKNEAMDDIDIGGSTPEDDSTLGNGGEEDVTLDNHSNRMMMMKKDDDKTEMDQETYERMLLAPDSSDDEMNDLEENIKDGKVQDEILQPEWDPFRQVQDVEDFEFLRLAILEKLGLGASISETENKETTTSDRGGCARSRGYYVISDAEKATYLPKNKAVLDTSSLTGRLSSRTNRVNNRRFAAGMEMQKKVMADSDILKFNQLKGRKKQLRFAKSPIHDWGLYAEEHIDANDMVIEYVGEVIRQQVAEEREKTYGRCGIGSSYLFRVDDDIVIDATKKGSIARFINHCCSPNCTAKIITVDKHKKIVIYANRDIEPGEEITYDYKFPLEAEKIPCLCGSKACKLTLN